jgi:uncharacterized protein YndB with AHSA1/START domain
MVDIIHRVGVRGPVADVYRALSTIDGIAGWWTKETTGHSEPGGQIDVRFSTKDGRRKGGMQMKVMALEPNRRVHWRFRQGPAEWIGTDAIFRLSEDGDFTIVRFGHRNWREPVEFTEHCSTKWATFLMSLKAFVETGQGRPAPDGVRIGDWH